VFSSALLSHGRPVSHKGTARPRSTRTRAQAALTGIRPQPTERTSPCHQTGLRGFYSTDVKHTKPTGSGNADVLWHIFPRQIRLYHTHLYYSFIGLFLLLTLMPEQAGLKGSPKARGKGFNPGGMLCCLWPPLAAAAGSGEKVPWWQTAESRRAKEHKEWPGTSTAALESHSCN